jgi:hypothetical protein
MKISNRIYIYIWNRFIWPIVSYGFIIYYNCVNSIPVNLIYTKNIQKMNGWIKIGSILFQICCCLLISVCIFLSFFNCHIIDDFYVTKTLNFCLYSWKVFFLKDLNLIFLIITFFFSFSIYDELLRDGKWRTFIIFILNLWLKFQKEHKKNLWLSKISSIESVVGVYVELPSDLWMPILFMFRQSTCT